MDQRHVEDSRRQTKVSVVIACHDISRLALTNMAIESAMRQTLPPNEIIVAVDHNPELLSILRSSNDGVVVTPNDTGLRGASTTRNIGVLASSSPIISFLDDDASARPDWLRQLVAPFSDMNVVGTGGAVEPRWEREKPKWFPEEFGWVFGIDYTGLPKSQGPIRNVWSENMAVRRDTFEKVGGFRSSFGKVGSTSRPEDTDLCFRMAAISTASYWEFVPSAIIDHFVPNSRARLIYFAKRNFSEGGGKIELSHLHGDARDLSSESEYLKRLLVSGLTRRIAASVVHRDRRAAQEAGAIVIGLACAGAGAVVALIRQTLKRSSPTGSSYEVGA